MRLTLRTLLAYRDGVLNPVDREDLHRRIQQNEVASNLLKRIERVSRELHGASVIVGKGPAADPNTLAAYLDDSLPKEQVAELERVVLASDHYLGELAQCHHLLATALNHPVKVPAHLRELGKKIGDPQLREEIKRELRTHKQAWRQSELLRSMIRADRPHSSDTSAGSSETQSPARLADDVIEDVELVGPGHPVGTPQSDSDAGMEPATASSEEQLSEPNELVQVQAPMMASAGESIREEGLDLESETLFREVPDYLRDEPGVAWRLPVAITVLAVILIALIWQAIGPWERVKELLAGNPGAAAPPSPMAEPSTADEETTAAGASDVPFGAAAADASTGGDSDAAQTDQETTQAISSSEPAKLPSTGSSVSNVVGGPGLDREGQTEPPPRTAAEGEFPEQSTATDLSDPSSAAGTGGGAGLVWAPSNEQEGMAVILTTGSGGELAAVEQGGAIPAGTTWVVPPNYRTTLRLPSGGEWTVGGPTRATLVKDAVAHVNAKLARALVTSNAASEKFLLTTPVGPFAIELVGAGSIVALDVGYRRRALGSLLDRTVFPPVVTIVAAKGRVRVTPSTQDGSASQAIELTLGEGLAAVGMERPKRFKLGRIPAWYRQSHSRPIDQLGAQDLARELAAARGDSLALAQRLRQLTEHRRPEAAAAAIQASLMLGDFEPMVRVLLREARFSAHWNPTLELAQQVLAATPEAASVVQDLFVQEFDQKGEAAYRAWTGQVVESPNQTLATLAGLLDDPQLAVRVVAAFALRQFTGRDFGYQPQFADRQTVLAIRRELSGGRVQPLAQFDVLWEQSP
ncbi:MAG: hypothetical protein D6753_03490 [Planctomycetota bacterium]|nr:MAG: hypothetical protein D6753_03490 [Planctomycetota bacterium]